MSNLRKAFDGNDYATNVIEQMWGISPKEVHERLKKDQVPAYFYEDAPVVQKIQTSPSDYSSLTSSEEIPMNKSLLLTLGALFGAGLVGTALWRVVRDWAENHEQQIADPSDTNKGNKGPGRDYGPGNRRPAPKRPSPSAPHFKPETTEEDLHVIRRADGPRSSPPRVSRDIIAPSDVVNGPSGPSAETIPPDQSVETVSPNPVVPTDLDAMRRRQFDSTQNEDAF